MTARGLRRREFLRGAIAASAAGMTAACRPTDSGDAETPDLPYRPGEPLPWRNWAGNQGCRPAARLAPATEDEIAALLAGGTGPIRP